MGCFAPKPLTRLFPQLSWKSRGKRALSKNFSVILSVCWFTKDNGESLHPILLDSFGIFISVISMQSDREKFLADAFFCPPSFEGGGPLAVEDFFYTLCLRRVTFVRSYKSNQKSFYLACQFQQAMFCIPYKSIEYEAHSHRLVHLLMNNNF